MKEHKLKHSSSYIVVVLASLRHKACIYCGKPIRTLEDAFAHWDEELTIHRKDVKYQEVFVL